MKSLIVILISIIAFVSPEKTTVEKYTVSGVCGMCKKKIETAAIAAGAMQAVYNPDNNILKVKYQSSVTSKEKILKAVADTGYDNELYKATDEAYQSLHSCCKYRGTKNGKKCE